MVVERHRGHGLASTANVLDRRLSWPTQRLDTWYWQTVYGPSLPGQCGADAHRDKIRTRRVHQFNDVCGTLPWTRAPCLQNNQVRISHALRWGNFTVGREVYQRLCRPWRPRAHTSCLRCSSPSRLQHRQTNSDHDATRECINKGHTRDDETFRAPSSLKRNASAQWSRHQRYQKHTAQHTRYRISTWTGFLGWCAQTSMGRRRGLLCSVTTPNGLTKFRTTVVKRYIPPENENECKGTLSPPAGQNKRSTPNGSVLIRNVNSTATAQNANVCALSAFKLSITNNGDRDDEPVKNFKKLVVP